MSAHIAWADRRGVIEFGQAPAPDGMIVIARSRGRTGQRMRDRVSAAARHAYDGTTLLVPGIPEAEDDDEALDALISFRDRVQH